MCEYIIERQPMISSQGEAQDRGHNIALDKRDPRRIWLYADADHIYVSDPKQGSRGFGGATLEFPLGEKYGGGSIKLQGAWKSNSRSLYVHTGVDLRDMHLTFGVIARHRGHDEALGKIILRDVLHKDGDWEYGPYDRIKGMAQGIADRENRRIHYYSASQGGSITSWCDPRDQEE